VHLHLHLRRGVRRVVHRDAFQRVGVDPAIGEVPAGGGLRRGGSHIQGDRAVGAAEALDAVHDEASAAGDDRRRDALADRDGVGDVDRDQPPGRHEEALQRLGGAEAVVGVEREVDDRLDRERVEQRQPQRRRLLRRRLAPRQEPAVRRL
jgi:hypothetical protein